MPEGDSLRLAARRVEPVLGGETMTAFWARKLRGHRPRPGQRILDVRSHGKLLLIEFDRGLTLTTHLGMSGSWSTAGPDRAIDPIREPRLRVAISTRLGHALCRDAPRIETFLRTPSASAPHLDPTTNLGPDLLARPLDVDRIVTRARRDPDALVVDTLLDQGVAAGIGNVYASEVLHVGSRWPFTLTAELTDAELARLFTIAADLLHRNADRDRGRRRTTPHGGAFVYDRYRLPCRRCGTAVERSRDGRDGRTTYWCPRCQPPPVRPD